MDFVFCYERNIKYPFFNNGELRLIPFSFLFNKLQEKKERERESKTQQKERD